MILYDMISNGIWLNAMIRYDVMWCDILLSISDANCEIWRKRERISEGRKKREREKKWKWKWKWI